MNGTVHAVDVQTGTQIWNFTAPGGAISGSPVVSAGTVYVGSWDTRVYAIDVETGTKRWAFDGASNRIYASLTVIGSTVYVGSFDGTLYAVDTNTGEKKWTFDGARTPSGTIGPIASSPIVVDRTVYVGTSDSTLRAINAWNGTQEWQFTAPTGSVTSSPTVSNGTVYVGSDDSTVYAVDADRGTQEWAFEKPSGAVRSSPTVADGTVFVGSNDKTLYAVDADDGTQEWAFRKPSASVYSSPTVANQTVYFGATDGRFYAVDATSGIIKWSSTEPDGALRSSPIVLDGMAYVGSNAGGLYAFATGADTARSAGSRATQRTLGHISRCPDLELQDTDNDCIPDIVANADLQMPPDSDAPGQPIDLDPTTRDTSGDGIQDQVLIDIEYEVSMQGGERVVDATVTEAVANPGRIDTDGDGTSDREELLGIDPSGGLEWTYDAPDGKVQSSPTVVDGVAYIGSTNSSVHAVDVQTGKKLWEFSEPTGAISGSPTVSDGTVYVGSWDTTLYAIDSDTGQKQWSFETPSNWIYSSPTVIGSTVYVGSFDSTIYSVDTETGEQQWTFNGNKRSIFDVPFGPVASSPTVVDQTVYVGSEDGTLRAIDAWSGRQDWQFDTPSGAVASSPTVSDGTVYVGANDNTLYAINATSGEQVWAFEKPSGVVHSSPTVANGVVYVGSNDNTVYAIDAATGEQEWAFEKPSGAIRSSPTVADGVVYVGSDDKTLYAIDADTGTQEWAATRPTGSVRSSPIVLDGTVYVGTDAGRLFAFETGDGTATSEGSRATQRTLGHISRCPDLELEDSDEDCIPDIVASADLRMPAGSPAAGQPLNLDPTTRDTSGNGIQDQVLVDITYEVSTDDGERTVDATVTEAVANPSRLDTDGDGLTDRKEFRGRTIAYTDSRNDTLEFISDLKQANTSDQVGYAVNRYMTTESVQPDPRFTDTDGDGLSDPRERRLGTDPRAADTTGDGASDSEVGTAKYDPTLYDVSPPKISVDSAYLDTVDRKYLVNFTVEEPIGLDSVQFRRGGKLEKNITTVESGNQTTVSIPVGSIGTIADLFTGTKITVRATDTNANPSQKLAYEQSDVFGAVAEKLAASNFTPREIKVRLGMLSGLSTGAGGTASSFAALAKNPLEVFPSIQQLVQAIENLDKVIAAVERQTAETQQTNNPFDENTDNYEAFREGWYQGYVGWFLIETLVPASKIGTVVKSSKRFQTVTDRLRSSKPGKLNDAAQFARRAEFSVSAPKRVARYQISRGLSAGKRINQRAAQRVLKQVPTVGKQVRTTKRVNPDADLEKLSKTQQQRLGDTLAEADADTGRALRRMDSDQLDDLTRLDVDTQTRADLAPAYSKLDAEGRQRARDLVDQQSETGVRLLSELDADSARNVLELPCRPARATVGSAGAGPIYGLTQSCPITEISDEEWDAYAKTLGEASKNIDGRKLGQTAEVLQDVGNPDDVIKLFDEPDNPEGVVNFVAQARGGRSSRRAKLQQYAELTNDGVPKQRLQRFAGDTGPDGLELVTKLERPQSLMDIESKAAFSMSWDDWRANIVEATQGRDFNSKPIETDRKTTYINNVNYAIDQDKIENPEGLIDELGEESDKFVGQYGEARSAKRYAEKNDQSVRIEPDDGSGSNRDGYDKQVPQQGGDYIEVKTREPRKPVTQNWVESKLGDMESKLDDAEDVSRSESILEIQTIADRSNAADIKDAVRNAMATKKIDNALSVREVRIVFDDGSVERITSSSISPTAALAVSAGSGQTALAGT